MFSGIQDYFSHVAVFKGEAVGRGNYFDFNMTGLSDYWTC